MKRFAALTSLALAACAPAMEDSSPAPVGGVTGSLFVAGKFANMLSRVDLATGEETARVESCANPHELASSPDERYVALACYGGTSVDIFRTGDLGKLKSIELGENAQPHGIVWHSNG
ncbi:MAG: YncE family protein, partial [Qipengyuania sp.]